MRRSIGTHSEKGFSVLEVMVSVAMLSVLSGMALFQMKDTIKPAQNAASQIVAEVKQARAKALATTYAYRLRATSSTQIVAEYATNCSAAAFTADSALTLNLPKGVTMSSTAWTVCFSSRGTSTTSANITVTDSQMSRTVQIAMGGGVQIT